MATPFITDVRFRNISRDHARIRFYRTEGKGAITVIDIGEKCNPTQVTLVVTGTTAEEQLAEAAAIGERIMTEAWRQLDELNAPSDVEQVNEAFDVEPRSKECDECGEPLAFGPMCGSCYGYEAEQAS